MGCKFAISSVCIYGIESLAKNLKKLEKETQWARYIFSNRCVCQTHIWSVGIESWIFSEDFTTQCAPFFFTILFEYRRSPLGFPAAIFVADLDALCPDCCPPSMLPPKTFYRLKFFCDALCWFAEQNRIEYSWRIERIKIMHRINELRLIPFSPILSMQLIILRSMALIE